MTEGQRSYPSTDLTKWVVAQTAPLTATGTDEIVAMFVEKKKAIAWARTEFGPKWRRDYRVGRRI